MKHKILCALLVAASTASYAQVKIGNNPSSIDPSSILELESPNKAFYINRVALTGLNDVATVFNPKAGMIVYNTATGGGVTPGLYYFDGTKWVSTNALGTVTANAWLLTGNGGTNDGVNYLGTNDQMAMNFRVNGQKAGRIEYGNQFFTAPGGTPQGANVSLGFGTLFFNTPGAGGAGSHNTAMGNYALNNNTTGRRNTAIGYDVLGQNTTGDSSTGIGFGALQVNTTGNNNTGLGAYSLNHNTIGAHNTAVGYQALLTQVADSGNTAVGAYSMYNSNTSKGNVAVGFGSLFNNLGGDSNTVVGMGAGGLNTVGSNNTYLGFNANGVGVNLRWTGAIGADAIVTVQNGLSVGATDAGAGAKNSLVGGVLTPQPMTSYFMGINVMDPSQRIDFRNGHIRNRQDNLPTVNVPLPAGNGVTAAGVAAGSSDVRGVITTVGYNNSNGLTQIRVNFQYQCTNPPVVTITPANESTSTATWYVTSDTNGFDLFFRNVYSGSNASGPAAAFNYHVIE